MARNHRLIAFAKDMRRQPSPAEERLWRLLRAGRHLPVKFSRQVVAGPYILDFAARAAKLAIELDGTSHDDRGGYDERRTEVLASLGYRVIRLTNRDVLEDADGVLAAIADALGLAPLPSAACGGSLPFPARGERVVGTPPGADPHEAIAP